MYLLMSPSPVAAALTLFITVTFLPHRIISLLQVRSQTANSTLRPGSSPRRENEREYLDFPFDEDGTGSSPSSPYTRTAPSRTSSPPRRENLTTESNSNVAQTNRHGYHSGLNEAESHSPVVKNRAMSPPPEWSSTYIRGTGGSPRKSSPYTTPTRKESPTRETMVKVKAPPAKSTSRCIPLAQFSNLNPDT